MPFPFTRFVFSFLALTFLTAVTLFTRHNAFPYTYHPDEDTKVRQVITAKRNYFHPLLMLTTTTAVVKAGHWGKQQNDVARAGRCVAAVFSAVAVAALAALAFRWTGWPGMVCAAVFLTLNPLIFELAHYFKEDPALLMGIAVTFLGLDIFWQSPGRWQAAFLGLGCALAISGKYLGVMMLLFAIPLLVIRCRADKRLILWFLGGFVLPLAAINGSLFFHLNDFSNGLSREFEGATEGHRGVKRQIPHTYYFPRINELTPVGLWLGLVLCLAFFVRTPKKRTLPQWLTFLFPFLFFAMLSFSPKTAGRYLLPVEAFVAFLAALGVGFLMGNDRNLRGLPALAALLIFFAGTRTSANDLSVLFGEFARDARNELRTWIAAQTPANAVIAQDGRVDLAATPTWRSARPLLSSEFAADLGSITELRSKGVTHVAVARQVYNRFFDPGLRPSAKERSDFNRRSTFYHELFQGRKPVWESPLGKVIYLQPGIRVYDISEP